MLYAPDLGQSGLDFSIKRRYEVFCQEGGSGSNDSAELLQDMDDTLPFYPEIVSYRVFSITVGM